MIDYSTRDFDVIINGHHVSIDELVKLPIGMIETKYGKLSIGQFTEIKGIKNNYFGFLGKNLSDLGDIFK